MSRFPVKDIINYQKGVNNGREKLPNIGRKVQYQPGRDYPQENVPMKTKFSFRKNPGVEKLESCLYQLNLELKKI